MSSGLLLWVTVLISFPLASAAKKDACLLSIDRSTSKVLSESVDEIDNHESQQFVGLVQALLTIDSGSSMDDTQLPEVQSEDAANTTEEVSELMKVHGRLNRLMCQVKEAAGSSNFFGVEADLTEEVRLPHARKCAVVSNSGVLLEHNYGPEIDAADLVIRFNDAELGGEYSTHVGSRDDVRVLNRLVGTRMIGNGLNISEGVLYLLSRFRQGSKEVRDYVSTDGASHRSHILACTGDGPVNVEGGSHLEKAAHKILQIDDFKRFRPGGIGNPTTGFLGFILAMSLCDEVHAYGFVASRAAYHAPFHYFGKLKKGNAISDKTHANTHTSSSEERDVFQHLSANHDAPQTDVTIVPGFSRISGC
mmetsp:Transcript_54642/g.130393  ORF Transcript_54642/g.130393 Transcript_54642/m.130393 type:complete len:363 (-) Transcript_54642:125-1213(-)